MWIILGTKFGDMKISGVGPILTAGNSLGVDPILNVGKCCFTLCDSQ